MTHHTISSHGIALMQCPPQLCEFFVIIIIVVIVIIIIVL